jgi:hypothetical protein
MGMRGVERVAGRPMKIYSHEEEEEEVCHDILDNISACRHMGNVEKHNYSTKWPCVGK